MHTGEIGAGQTITALYELVLNQNDVDNADQVFVTFDCRYKKALNEASIPLQTTMTVAQIFNKNGRPISTSLPVWRLGA